MYIPEKPAPTMTASNSVVAPARAARDSSVELAVALFSSFMTTSLLG
jgi:hypothetical protein